MTTESQVPQPLPAPTASLPVSLSNFSYTAQTDHGLRLSGTIEAPDGAAATRILENMRLRVIEVNAVKARHASPMNADTFLAFNRQLAQLAATGVPIEKGLRLIAAGVRSGKLSRTVTLIAADLQAGVPLADAFEKYRGQFPPLYGQLIDAGVRGGNLPVVLLNLGRRLEVQYRLRSALWKSTAYPLMTLCGLLLVLGFLGVAVIPRFQIMFAEFHMRLPLITEAIFWTGGVAPYLAAGAVGLLAIISLVWAILRITGMQGLATDRLLLPVPLVGPVLRFNLIARWVDVMRIGILAGLEVSAAIKMAGEATASRTLQRDGEELIATVTVASPLSTAQGRLLPATIPTAIDVASNDRELSDTLQTLGDLYERQAEIRLERIPALLTPLLMMLIALAVGLVICGIALPLIAVIEEMTGISGK